MKNDARSALVLFSGGQDSTTCLAWALERFERVETMAFDYRQRHRIELDQRLAVLDDVKRRFPRWAEQLGDDHFIDLGVLGQISDTSLTRDLAFAMKKDGLPNTFVPGRNLLFFTFAAAIAWRRDVRNLVGGMCETDFSGYPDCRDNTIKALQVALNLGMDRSFTLHTPLMWLDKAETWALARELGGEALVDIELEHTHTCCRRERGPRHPWRARLRRMPGLQPAQARLRNVEAAMPPARRMTMDSRKVEGLAYVLAFIACIPTANWLIGHLGVVCVTNGPCLVPVFPWGPANEPIMAPSGVLMIGLALVLRDLVQRRLGRTVVLLAITAGAALSGAVAPPELVLASATAFLFSELADFAVYTPLEKRGLVLAVFVSSVVGLVIDSLLFLWLAFGSLEFLAGQVLGKFWMVLLALPAVHLIRRWEVRP